MYKRKENGERSEILEGLLFTYEHDIEQNKERVQELRERE